MARIRHPAERFALHTSASVPWCRASTHSKSASSSVTGSCWERGWRTPPASGWARRCRALSRGCKPYGRFVELTPNLSGLADSREDIPEGRLVSVYIRSIQPQTGKIKLQMVQELGQPDFPTPLHYQITGGSVSGWRYRP
ncbi:MAG: hypothetical protein ACLU38_09035 [Dysosmobacter sp.]